jgi:hypothetical protein
MKQVGWLRWASVIAAELFFLPCVLAGPPMPTSTCVQCHTDVKKLIRLGWEVEKVRGKPKISAENEGEG